MTRKFTRTALAVLALAAGGSSFAAAGTASAAVQGPLGQFVRGSFSYDRTFDQTQGNVRYQRDEHWVVTLGKDRSSAAVITGTVDFTVTETCGGALPGAPQPGPPMPGCGSVRTGHYSGSSPIGVSILRDDEAAPFGGDPSFYRLSMAWYPTGTAGIPGTLTTQTGSGTTTDTTPFQPNVRATVAFGEPRSRTAYVDASQTSPMVPQGTWPQDVHPLVLHLTSDCLDGKDNDGDGKLDAADPGCPRSSGSMESDTLAPPENRPPVARADRYHLKAGSFLWTSALANDSDPDGDKFTARVTRIEFRRKEWKGMDLDGTFTYVAGTNARIAMKKVIVYHLVDEHGARSPSAKITIDIDKPGVRRPSPLDKHPNKARSAAAGRWYANPATLYSCRGAGFERECYGVMSPRQVAALNAATPWVTRPSIANATSECAQRGIRGAALAGCIEALAGLLYDAGDKQVFRLAANAGACLVFKRTLDRTLRHPRAGEWSKPEFHTTHSYLPQGKWGTWPRGATGKWRLPVSCNARSALVFWPMERVALEPDHRAPAHCCLEAMAIAGQLRAAGTNPGTNLPSFLGN